MQQGWIYEALVSTFCDGEPHAAPMGVWTDDAATIRMEIFRSSHTLRGILETGCLVAGFPAEATMFHTALFHPDELVFDPVDHVSAPVPRGCAATVELRLEEAITSAERVSVAASVAHVTAGPGLKLFNRAEGLLVESLILATRLEFLDESAVRGRLAENDRVIRKVAPGSSFEAAMARLLEDVRPRS